MPTNNFKLFDEKKANMMTDEDYAINQQRLNGVQSGVASSQLQNKTLYQTALMCYALAQLMAANGYDANDANAVSTFVNNLSLSMVQKVVDKASANDVAQQTAGKWVDAKQLGELKKDVADNYLPLLGGTMLGDLLLNRDPISSLQAATKQYVDKFAKCFFGSYIGNGTAGASNKNVLTFSFTPIIVFVIRDVLYNNSTHGPAVFLRPNTKAQINSDKSNLDAMVYVEWTDNSVLWYNDNNRVGYAQLNDDGITYYYVAIGNIMEQ